MKKLIALCLALLMAFTLAACGGGAEPPEEPDTAEPAPMPDSEAEEPAPEPEEAADNEIVSGRSVPG